MERLIADANKYRKAQGKNADLTVDSFADIVEAIQTVQEEQGIAGTTADEAMRTIQGSADATKAAWKNVVTAIAGGGDLKQAMSGLTESIFGTDGETGLLNQIIPRVQTAFEGLADFIGQAAPLFAAKLPELVSAILPSALSAIGSIIKALASAMPGMLSAIWESIKAVAPALMETLRAVWLQGWEAVKQVTSTAWNGIKSVVSNMINGVKNTISNVVETIKSKWGTAWDNIKTKVSTIFDGIKTTIKSKIDAAKQSVTSVLDSIKTAFSTKLNSAKQTVKNVIDKIKGLFNFSWSLPKLKLPHISITGSFSLSPPSVPHFSISWYRKALNDAILLDNATIFGASRNGTLLGGGEAGSEMIVGTNLLRDTINDAVGNGQLVDLMRQMLTVMQTYLPEAATRQLVLDTGVIAGAVAPGVDTVLGSVAGNKRRYAAS